MESTIIDMGEKSLKEYMFQYLAAASVSKASGKDTITAWYSRQPLHVAALSLDLGNYV